MIFVARVQREGPPQIHIEMDLCWHGSLIARNISIHPVRRKQAKRCAVNSRTQREGIRGPAVEVSIAVGIRACGDVVRLATRDVEKRGEVNVQGKVEVD